MAANMTMDTKILVVDDEPEVLFATSRPLKKAGYMVLEAETGQKGLELAREHLPDLILSDVVLPDMDGVEVCRSLKAGEMTSDIHVVLITGKRLATDDKVFGLEEGADDYIMRPIRNHELLARVKAQLRLVRAEKELKEHQRLLENLLERRSAELKSEKAEHQLTACSLVESEKQCQDLVKNLPGTAYQFVLNAQGDSYFQYMGDNCLSLFGYRPEEILAKPNLVFDRIPQPDRDTVTRAMEASAATMTPYNVVHRYIKKTGERVWIHASSIPSLRPDGGIVWNGIGLDITERKLFEEALRENEAFLKELIDAIPMPIFYKDRNGKYLGFNKAFETFFGETREHMIGKSVFDINPPELAKIYSAQDDELFSSGGVQRYESQWKNAHGRLCDFIFNKAAFTDGKGNVAGLIGVLIDISDRKKAEEELRESKLFLDSMSDIAYRADDRGNLIWVNSAGESITGLSREDIIGKPFLPLFIESDHASLMEVYNRTLSGESLENTLTFTSGVTCHFTSLPYRNENNDIVGTFGVARDITERISAEKALSVSEDRLKKAQKAAKIGNWEYDVATGKVWGSEEAFRIYGIERKSEYLPLDEVESHIIEAKRVNQALIDLLTTEKEYDIEFQITQGNTQKIKTIHSIAELVKDHKGNPIKVLGVIQDITEKKAREEENIKLIGLLQHAQKLESIGNLAGGIAHDFNNILFPILGLSELLVEDLSPDSLEHENARQILKAAERGSDLVQQILAFSRQTDHKMMPIRIQNVLKEALKLARSTIPANIEIEQHIQRDCGLVNADATQVHQIAMNLITNAFHAVEHTDGKINVQLKEVTLESEDIADLLIEPGSYAMLTVSDTGCGIAPLNIKRIFEPYFTTKEQGKGTGLGLAVVYGIIKEHRGDIKVESELNEGTTFTVYVPLIEKPNNAESIERNVNYETGDEHILLVDDEKPILQVEKQMLERLGYQVTFRTSGLDALETFAANPNSYDMVISDMSMPNITGDKLAQKLISIRPDVPIILCTGFSERIEKGKADAIGIKGLLSKPIAKLEMAKMVRKVLDEAKSTAQE